MKTTIIVALAILLSSKLLVAQTKDYNKLLTSAQQQRDSAVVIKTYLEKLKKLGPDTSHSGRMEGNNLAFRYFSKYSGVKKGQLKGIIAYMELFVDRIPANRMGRQAWGSFNDTYASLLYRVGRKKEALARQKKAVELFPENREINENYQQMLSNSKI